MLSSIPISLVIPTYRRDDILIATIRHLLRLDPKPAEILVLDQTEKHQESVEKILRHWEAASDIRLIRLAEPSIPQAMNRGLCEAKHDFVLFVDDDIVPEVGLHLNALDIPPYDIASGIPARIIGKRSPSLERL